MSWLSTTTLVRKIKRNADDVTRNAFEGVYSMDQLPKTIPHYPFLMIINTHSHNLPGEHWISVFINKQREAEVFDSLAMPMSITLMRWLNRHSWRWKRNDRRYQNPFSSTCGAFVLFYALQRARSSFQCVINLFKNSYHDNERIVDAFYQRLK